ncbi:hypothetical protein L6164_004600, partial [Bauhinia variegata]
MLKMCVPLRSNLLVFLFLVCFCFPSTITSLDIAKVLSQNPSFTTFTNYLTQTQLVGQINNRQTVTVLAVDNAAMSPISGKSMDFITKVLSIHVILDYYDVKKLQHLDGKFAQVTTLYQSSGQDGFLNITHKENGVVSFASASASEATLISSVASEPYNLSVIQVSSLIIPGNSPTHSNSRSPSISSAPDRSPTASPKEYTRGE